MKEFMARSGFIGYGGVTGHHTLVIPDDSDVQSGLTVTGLRS
jgi:hypothetical protein